jgi:hypothetical protein
MSNKKVYCTDCVYYNGNIKYVDDGKCKHKSMVSVEDTPIKRKTVYGDCMTLNHNNHCKLFKKVISLPRLPRLKSQKRIS